MSEEDPVLFRLINIRRKLKDLLLAKRLSLDPERTGVVELADFGKRCEQLAAFAASSAGEVAGLEAVAGDLELAARLAARLETLPPSRERFDQQLRLLEEVAREVEAAIQAGGALEEPPALLSLSTLARAERERFEPLIGIEGRIHDSPTGLVRRGEVLRLLRRALLDHDDEAPFPLEVTADGVLRFGGFEITAEPVGDRLERGPNEPPEVRRALDMREGTDDPALRAFLLVKAVDEALAAVLAPRMSSHAFLEQARSLPRKPGKRMAVRPEAVQRDVEGWDAREAARGAEKLAARRIGPDWARLPRGAYLFRLFLAEDDALAADLLALGAALRRMEKGEPVEDTDERALRALRGLLGLLG